MFTRLYGIRKIGGYELEWLRDLYEREDKVSLLVFIVVVLCFWIFILIIIFSRCSG